MKSNEHVKPQEALQKPTNNNIREIVPEAAATDTSMTQEQSAFPAIHSTAMVISNTSWADMNLKLIVNLTEL